jgi:hypothetical protein
MPVNAGAAAGVNVEAAARSARTNDVEAGKARRILGWPGEAEQRFAVAVAEQEDKALQVLAQLLDAVGGVADEGGCGPAARPAGSRPGSAGSAT